MDSPPVIALDLTAANATAGFSDDEFEGADDFTLTELEEEDSSEGSGSSVGAIPMERTFKDTVHDYSASSQVLFFIRRAAESGMLCLVCSHP